MIVDKIALILVIVGALNWGGIGLFGFNTVAFLCGGPMTMLARIIYAVVGLGGPVVRYTAVPKHRGQPRPRPSYRLSPSKKERLTALFFLCYFPTWSRLASPSSGVTFTVR